ncbi:MAG TPA: hypothetical protein VFU06_03245 [Longimicrobiales bacterium]|nr:hypothetical protein [Longimicrobiales bacterium]
MRRTPSLGIALLALLALVRPATGQQPPLRIYVTCNAFCDVDFFRTELDYLEWMRDRADADVHVLVNDTDTGGGGERYELMFIGLDRFEGRTDTLSWFAEATATDDEIRRGVLQQLQVGLVPFLVDAGWGQYVQVEVDAPAAVATDGVEDPWNAWIFNVYGETELEGESSFFEGQVYAGASAQRVTEHWKVSLAFNNNYEEERFDVDSVTTAKSVRREWGISSLIARSISRHWSVGMLGSLRSNTFDNLQLSFGAAPAIEYNLYPYGEYTTRYVTVLYTAGVNRVDYEEITIYDELQQTLLRHTLTAAAGVTQPWGDVQLSVEALQYLHDLSRRRLVASIGTEVNLFRGLSLDVGGDFSWIADQISLRKRELSEEEILLRGGRLATDFSYEMRIGLSYSFGSRSNRAVNPRFDRTPGDGGYVF